MSICPVEDDECVPDPTEDLAMPDVRVRCVRARVRVRGSGGGFGSEMG